MTAVINSNDEQAQVLAVRNAKELADFVVFTMHNHANRYAYQAYSHDSYPADFMRPFIHKLIDNGLDMYVGHGSTRCRDRNLQGPSNLLQPWESGGR